MSTLRKLGVHQINYLIVSHNHPDHYGGIETLVGRVPIDTIIWNGRRLEATSLGILRKRSEALGTQWIAAEDGLLNVGHLRAHLYASPNHESDSENDASVAVLIDHRDTRILVTGDLETLGEQRLIEKNIGRVDILRAGHHGSRTSTHSTFLEKIQPSDVVLSMGRNNRFGFPHAEVVFRVRKYGARIWRTDRDGRVSVNLNGAPTIRAVFQSKQRLKPIAYPQRSTR